MNIVITPRWKFREEMNTLEVGIKLEGHEVQTMLAGYFFPPVEGYFSAEERKRYAERMFTLRSAKPAAIDPNVRNCTAVRMAKNAELQVLKQVLNLKEGVDYEDDTNFTTLRYGGVVVMADADPDGFHILGLLINLFHSK